MNQIRPWLAIGSFRVTLNAPLLRSFNINAMLQLAELVRQPQIVSHYIAVKDGVPLAPNKVREGVDFVLTHQAQGNNVLVSCRAGISRSTSFAMAVLKEHENLSLLEAYQEIRHCHADALPHPLLWKSLCEIYDEDIPYLELIRSNLE